MAGWFSRAETVTLSRLRAPEVSHEGLMIQLDQQGTVHAVSGTLRPELALDQPGQTLSEYLAPRGAALDDDSRRWRAGMVDLDFRRRGGGMLQTRGWLTVHEDGWQLQMIGVDDLLEPMHNAEFRRHSLSCAARLSESMRYVAHRDLAQHVGLALGELAVLWKTRQLAVALQSHGTPWRCVGHYDRDEAEDHQVDLQGLGEVLSKAGSARVIQLERSNRLAPTPMLLVPYEDLSGRACLMLYDMVASQHLPALRETDWQQAFACIAAVLLARCSQLQAQHEMSRQDTVQHLLGAGWWEFHPGEQQLELAPSLLERLALPGARLPWSQWLERVQGAERDELRVRMRHLLEEGRAFTLNLRLGDEVAARWYQWQGQQIGQGRSRRYCGLLLDVDERHTQQVNASLADARLRNLLASAPAVVYVQRHEQGNWELDYCSDSLAHQLGWELADLQGGALAERVHPDDLSVFFERIPKLIRDGAISMRYRLRDQAGEVHWLLDEAKLLRDEEGVPLEVVGVWLDVTEATLATERIAQSEERYRALVEDSPVMICRYDAQLNLSFANQPLADYLHQSPQALVGSNLSAWLSGEQLNQFRERLAALTPEQPIGHAEVCMALPGRDHAWWVWCDRAQFDADGKLLEVQAVARDNTEVRRVQQQLLQGAKMATLGEMATGMAHELNQPLNVMRMAVANILRKADGGALELDYLREKLGRIEAQVGRAAKIVDHMRVFGRRSAIEQQPFDPFEAVDGALSLLEENLTNKGVRISWAGWDGPALQVRGFVDQLEQVLINLMVNASHAMFDRQAEGLCEQPSIVIHGEQYGERVHIVVEDSGGGIDPLVIERIFEPFFTTKEVGKGTGLGLSVSYGIVQSMEGELSVRNTEQGARFCIDLPVYSAAPQ